MIFTVVVIINVTALITKSNAQWVGFLALPPLLLLVVSGLYLFILPYATKGRAARSTE